ncbi:MAG: eIF2 kinase Gcn2p negative regulator [Trizodia sp. TS-e1964]|nr:MAG: eIF2 kinase Gcn2p negative regulator [Trizodia sp. TS-e1964]
MSEELESEIEAINSIYGEGTLGRSTEGNAHVLSLPQTSSSIRISFPASYPELCPIILGTHASGEVQRKGNAARMVDSLRTILARVFQPGHVCVFDLLEEASALLAGAEDVNAGAEVAAEVERGSEAVETPALQLEVEPCWVVSETLTEKKSVFVARCAAVSTPQQARSFVQHLLSSDRKVGKASHNITAWRIRGANNIAFQDCDDDGETAAGGRVLHLMQLMDIWNAMVVVSRWYGGVHLGPDR